MVGTPEENGAGARMARTLALFVHGSMFVAGTMIIVHVAYIGLSLDAQGHWADRGEMWAGLRNAYILLLRSFLMPFMEASFLDPYVPHSIDLDVWGFFVPGILCLFITNMAWLGLTSLRWPSSGRAIVYSLFAAVLLVSQAQVNQAMNEITSWEELMAASGPAQSKSIQPWQIQQHLFKASHSSFGQIFTEAKCKIVSAVSTALQERVECSAETAEATLLPVL
ncbi:unnamed protein product, partial [Polarella glacialis]